MRYPALVLSLGCIIPISVARAHGPFSTLKSRSISSDAAAFAKTSYDYIIVGAGTAGSALAAGLSESGKYKVGVLEAGISGYGESRIDVPGYFGATFGTTYDWNYTTLPSSSGVPPIYWPRGRVLGGTSALNLLAWNRPSREEYDAWEKLGNPGWNWDSLVTYLKKAENYHPPSAEQVSLLNYQPALSAFGTGGSVQVSFEKFVAKATSLWVPALEALGIKKNNDVFSGSNIGASCGPSDINPVNSSRSYAAPAYLFPNAARKNLAVLTSALVEQINWSADKEDGNVVASGVTFTSGGQSYTVNTTREVIISSGSINTPQLLELSGIGSSEILASAGVKQVINLPSVGENLQDHASSSSGWERTDNEATIDTLHGNTTYAAEQAALYANNSTSILDQTLPGLTYITLSTLVGDSAAEKLIAAVATYVNASTVPYKKALLQQLAFLTDDAGTVGQLEILNYDGLAVPAAQAAPNKTYNTFVAAQQHPFSRGSVHINSSSAAQHPVINANYLAVPFDTEVIAAGLAYVRKIAATPGYAVVLGTEVAPGLGTNLANYTVEYLQTEYHPVGTASMLPRGEGGVVDSTLKVYGTANVRVVDASIIPLHIAAHLQSTCYAIAGKAVDIILADS
ncbi:GMC oxidoreductase [Athelia psychrophila]|uniref:GMC oxidoreductase n=1 Tax=Athelia psychrophila TaxID=1759441 RepID=A0A166CK68_9AGAM|nr:GMC oxidoreductase [Fibularhizoctonia sp. CBS 109695]